MDEPNLESGCVYVLDDIETARLHAKAHLERLGWTVKTFADAAAFLAGISKLAPEAALVDIRLPQGSGSVIASRLRRHPRTQAMRLVAYTGVDAEEHPALLEAGFDAVIAKPGLAEDFARHLPMRVRPTA